jgi:DNA-binding CsgD family transcriptional regulator
MTGQTDPSTGHPGDLHPNDGQTNGPAGRSTDHPATRRTGRSGRPAQGQPVAPGAEPVVRFHLDRALQLIAHDRWVLGGVHEGKLRVLFDSSPEPDRPFRRIRPLSHLARRCLHEGKPVAVTALGEPPPQPANWEIDWPSLLYAPVGMPGRRPVGLLVLGSRTDHWYVQEEIDYVASLGVTLTSMALSVVGPVDRLRGSERRAAHLVSLGLSASEIAAALDLDRTGAQRLVARVLRKLALRSPRQLSELWPELEPL